MDEKEFDEKANERFLHIVEEMNKSRINYKEVFLDLFPDAEIVQETNAVLEIRLPHQTFIQGGQKTEYLWKKLMKKVVRDYRVDLEIRWKMVNDQLNLSSPPSQEGASSS